MIDRSKLDRWCDAVLEAGWLAAMVVAPLFFNVFSSRVFEPDKISLVRTMALTMIVVWLVKVANGGFAWLPAFSTGPPKMHGRAATGVASGATRFFIPVAADRRRLLAQHCLQRGRLCQLVWLLPAFAGHL